MPVVAFSVALLLLFTHLGSRYSNARDKAPAPGELQLTEAAKHEQDLRHACKVAVCAAMRNRSPGSDISCNLVKTWRKDEMKELAGKAKAFWPWGEAKCSARVKLTRDALVKAMTEPKFEVSLEKHAVACEVERDKDRVEVKLSLAPKATFENGKAVKAALNWGAIEGPALVKGAIWTVTLADNKLNVLQATLVHQINDFVTTKCDEVKSEWQRKR